MRKKSQKENLYNPSERGDDVIVKHFQSLANNFLLNTYAIERGFTVCIIRKYMSDFPIFSNAVAEMDPADSL